MKRVLKSTVALAFSVMLAVFFAMPCFAADAKGRVTITLCDKDKNNVNGMTVHVCQIAGINDEGYYPTKAFENSGVSIWGIVNNPDYLVAQSLADYVRENKLAGIACASDNGTAEFSDLDLGIWLVYPEENSRYTFNPYVVFLPFRSQGKQHYEIFSSPKVEDNSLNKISVYVVKKWDDRNNAAKKRPEFVDVELLNGQDVVETVKLDSSNAWSYTFKDLSKDGKYSVREKSVSNYKATYSGDVKNGFVVTNTYIGDKLPQAGQYWWPIAIIAVAGAGFVLLGIIELGAKKNGKKR